MDYVDWKVKGRQAIEWLLGLIGLIGLAGVILGLAFNWSTETTTMGWIALAASVVGYFLTTNPFKRFKPK